MDLLKNADGSVDIYMSPKPPKGFEKNWIPTVSGRAWFAYFRLYAPTGAYFDKSWPAAGHRTREMNKRDALIVNADSSVDLYFGPTPPAGKE